MTIHETGPGRGKAITGSGELYRWRPVRGTNITKLKFFGRNRPTGSPEEPPAAAKRKPFPPEKTNAVAKKAA